MDFEEFFRGDNRFFKVIVGDFNAKIGPRRTSEERHIETDGLQWNKQMADSDFPYLRTGYSIPHNQPLCSCKLQLFHAPDEKCCADVLFKTQRMVFCEDEFSQ
ncbi:hypothetical protein KIN20_027767 [Parelaphostrongylus tenuis]|uniref:Endonuclease/exonuclease/phosphatase domain-containing protein n=1 Tax=Parelaphostrongylus tenuis TaxID=148309 RepID=A0AAD5WE73_PARTN|nr:hypothetical protein KIN20_027767 [Parelaphostrongylus tenuis]